MDDLRVNEDVLIPGRELTWRFSPSGGPGGQHANRAHTRVELLFRPATSAAFDDATRAKVLERLSERLVGGELRVVADDERSQWRNRQIARRRLAELLKETLAPAPPPRRPTRPSRTARRKRVDDKRRRGELKRSRRRPEME